MNKFVKLALPANIEGRQRHPGDADTREDGTIEVSSAEAKRLEAAGVLDGAPLTAKELEHPAKADDPAAKTKG